MPARSPIPASALPGITLQSIALGGDPREALQTLLRERYRADGCRLLGSGTQSLQTALELASANNDKPVLLPAYSCYEVASAAVGANVRVALYDVDPNTLEPDWDSVHAAASEGVSALVVAPLYGLPLDWDAARAAADKLGVWLIADVAQAHGTEWRGHPAGTNADMTVLSFGRGKGWTGAGGGALLWRGDARATGEREAMAQRHQFVTEAKSAAKAGSQWLLGRRSLYGLPAAIPFLKLGETIYHDPSSPVGMTRTSAALVLASEAEARNEVLHRRRNAQRYSEWLEKAQNRIESVPGTAMNNESGALRYPLRLRNGWPALARTEAPRLGAARGYPAVLRELSALRRLLVNTQSEIRGADVLAREVVTLPTHSQMAEREMQRLVDLVGQVG